MIDDITISIEGTSFPTSGYEVVVIISGVESSSCTIMAATAMSATFDNGIPISSADVTPSIHFVPTTSSTTRRRLVALTDTDMQLIAFQDSITIRNALSVTSSSSDLSCSF